MSLSECSWKNTSSDQRVHRTRRNIADKTVKNSQHNTFVGGQSVVSNDAVWTSAWQRCWLPTQARSQEPSLCKEWAESWIGVCGEDDAPPLSSTTDSRLVTNTLASLLTVAGCSFVCIFWRCCFSNVVDDKLLIACEILAAFSFSTRARLSLTSCQLTGEWKMTPVNHITGHYVPDHTSNRTFFSVDRSWLWLT